MRAPSRGLMVSNRASSGGEVRKYLPDSGLLITCNRHISCTCTAAALRTRIYKRGRKWRKSASGKVESNGVEASDVGDGRADRDGLRFGVHRRRHLSVRQLGGRK